MLRSVQGFMAAGQTYSSFGNRCFTAAGLRLKQLPAGLRQTDVSYEQFKQLLKTFVLAYCDYCASPDILLTY